MKKKKDIFEVVFSNPIDATKINTDFSLPKRKNEGEKEDIPILTNHAVQFGQRWSAHGFGYIFEVIALF